VFFRDGQGCSHHSSEIVLHTQSCISRELGSRGFPATAEEGGGWVDVASQVLVLGGGHDSSIAVGV
jgi:hypothetical protein